MTEQERLIGEHPDSTHILGEWLTYIDQPTTVSKKHRKLEENSALRQKAIVNLMITFAIYVVRIIKRK